MSEFVKQHYFKGVQMKTIPNKKLKVILFDKGLTQRDLSFATRIDEGRISRIIRGYEQPTPEIKRDIAKYFRVEEREVF